MSGPRAPAGGAGDAALAAAAGAASDTRRVLLGPGAIEDVGALWRDLLGERAAVLVADEQTYAVAGEAVARALRAAGVGQRPARVFAASPRLHADWRHATALADALRGDAAVPLAVGAGTVNDLTKLGAHLAERPALVVATAASMDGYAAYGAAITRDGFKQTVACPAPLAVVGDVDVLAAAPGAMTASGFGDLAGKVPAGADWLLADALGVEPLDRDIWDLVQPAVREALGGAGRLAQGDPPAVAALFRCLVMSGLAMQAARSSRPASGAEHQLSHLWEMRGLAVGGEEVSHGFKVAVGSVLTSRLYERLLAAGVDALDPEARGRAWPSLEESLAAARRAHGGAAPALLAQVLAEVGAKWLDGTALRDRLERLRAVWPALRRRLEGQLLPAAELAGLLRRAGCPAAPEEIGLRPQDVAADLEAARQIRRRYTVLDVAAETGLRAGPELAPDQTPARAPRGDMRNRWP